MNIPADLRHATSTSEIPSTSRPAERSAAAAREKTFPYRFPRDRRQLGGKFSVEESSRRLRRFFYFERRLMQALGAWTLSIPEFEVKLETGRHIFYHARCCAAFARTVDRTGIAGERHRRHARRGG